MSRKIATPPKLPAPAIVTWTDASIRLDEDKPRREILETDPMLQTVSTCGWVLSLGRTNLVMAFETSPKAEDSPFRTIQRIPRRLVASIAWLVPRG